MPVILSHQLEKLMTPSKQDDAYTFDSEFEKETILITGAAGSLGSELVKRISRLKFFKLVLIDIAENALFQLNKELRLDSNINIIVECLDITKRGDLTELFKKYTPTLIFHTAAHKHVPEMESKVYEAITLNIGSTVCLSELAIKYKCRKFIFISTDKAVDPISVMGMTKAISENYLMELNNNHNISFVSARFGNILGSNGSALPIFLEQIKQNKPITITSTEATRYFISKKKAGNLILKIATFNKSQGNLFTFEMGTPIKIVELASYIMKEHDYRKKVDIVGLRTGEKLHEKIVSKNEDVTATRFPEILKITKKNSRVPKKKNLQDILNIPAGFNNDNLKIILKNYIEGLL